MKRRSTVYRIREFAAMAGVTVRALHHYDRLGLLKPSGRSASGYRLYGDCDLVRLEQIVVLKFLGLPLKQIGRLLRREPNIQGVLRSQRRVLDEKRQRIGWAIDAIREAEQSIGPGGELDWDMFKKIVKEIEMQNETDWAKKYYSPEAQASVEERRKLWSPELQAEVSAKWSQLFADIESAMADGETPAGARAQALAGRWRELLEGFTGGDPEIQKGLNRMWADHADWPAKPREAYAVKPEIQAFIVEALKAR
jgi:DNA-binding transcriptional MerR regulator